MIVLNILSAAQKKIVLMFCRQCDITENRQGWRRLNRGAEIEPTSSLVWADVFRADFQRVISLYLPNIIMYLFCAAQRLLRTIFMHKSKSKYACLPNKIVEVWIERYCVRYDWWRRLQPTSSVSPMCSVPPLRLICVTSWAIFGEISSLPCWHDLATVIVWMNNCIA